MLIVLSWLLQQIKNNYVLTTSEFWLLEMLQENNNIHTHDDDNVNSCVLDEVLTVPDFL